MMSKIRYNFSNELWKNNFSSWHFISVPNDMSKEIRDNLQWHEEGWGRMKVTAILEDFKWNTSIWFDTKIGCYILPIKLEIRNKLSLKEGDLLKISILV